MLLRCRACLLLVSLSLILPADAALARTWTSLDGNFSIDAELVDNTATTVRLKRGDGSVISVPLAKLSKADQDFVAAQSKPAADDAPAPSGGGDETKARELLEGKGLKILSGGLQLPDEDKLDDGLKESNRSRVDLNKATQQLALAEQQVALNRQQITQLTQLNVRLNAALTNVKPNDIATNNKLVGALQANDSQIQLLQQASGQLVEQERTIRSAYNDAREAYVQKILDLRTLANSVNSQYTKLAVDPDVRQAVADLNAATDKTYEVAASRSFQTAERRLTSLEDTVLFEAIPLRRDGDTFYVSVVLDGKHTQEMVVDSGATSVCLPQAVAKACGIEVGSQDPEIILILADGSRIRAHEVTVKSMRVGKFTVENVRCAVLGAEATEAESLLGLSFLGEFKFELDTQKETLTMVKVDEGGGSRIRK